MTERNQENAGTRLLEPHCLPTTIGSLPHKDVKRATSLIFNVTPQFPSWVQFPKLRFEENMIVQFSEGLPGLKTRNGKLYFDSGSENFCREQTEFYEKYISVTEKGDKKSLEYFKISESHSAGFSEFLNLLRESKGVIAGKGQVTGPVTMGLNIHDGEGRFAYYDPSLRDMIVKIAGMKALWQIEKIYEYCNNAIIFLDEPALLGFGSSMFITIGRNDVIGDINEVVSLIHKAGGISGVHCEENTDWSLLMDTDLDVLDFDAYQHFESIAMHWRKLGSFISRGGILGWGIVPTLSVSHVEKETVESLFKRFEKYIDVLDERGIERNKVLRQSMITPSCGMGGTLTETAAERVLKLLGELSETIRLRFKLI